MERTVTSSKTKQVQIIEYKDLNGYGRLFGGQLMEWIDTVAGVVARRHSGKNVTTAMIDSLRFRHPAYANNILVLVGYVTWVGHSSMEVCVKTYVEDHLGQEELINSAYVVMVALDENEHPVEVPRLKIETEEEQHEWDAAVLRRQRRIEGRELS